MPKFGYRGTELKRLGCPGDPGESTGTFEWAELVNGPDSRFYTVDTKGKLVAKSTEEIGAIKQSDLQTSIIATYETAVQAAMDKVAGDWGYGCPPGAPGSIGYAIGAYINSSNAQWKADAQALQTWLESVWTWANQQQTTILADPSKLPATAEEFVAMMPAAPVKPVVR